VKSECQIVCLCNIGISIAIHGDGRSDSVGCVSVRVKQGRSRRVYLGDVSDGKGKLGAGLGTNDPNIASAIYGETLATGVEGLQCRLAQNRWG
jgi:hypothetical protein